MRANNATGARSEREVWAVFGPWLAFFALIVLTRPYQGIYHDAYLYAAQALRHAEVGDLQQDLIFAFGNQDSFTVFSWIYAPLVQAMGVSAANGLVWALALGGWGCALITLARVLFPERQMQMLAVAAAIVLSPYYGDGVLAYGEGFVTPRPFAEALGLLALTAVLRGKALLGGVLVLAATMLHPLTGGVFAALLVWFILNSFRAFLVLCIAALLLIVGLAMAGAEPFTWILQPIDPDWLRVAKQQSALVFVQNWGMRALGLIALPLISLGLVITQGPKLLASVATGTLIVAAILLTISVLGADVYSNRLITSLQLWRVLGPFCLIGNMLAVTALMTFPMASWAQRVFALALALNGIGNLFDVLPVIPGAIAAVAVLFLALQKFRHQLWARLLIAALVLGIAILVLGRLAVLFSQIQGSELMSVPRVVLVAMILTGGVTALRRQIRMLLVCAALVGAVLSADQRGPWQKYVEGAQPPPDEVVDMVAGRQVYWEAGLDLMWFKFNQPQFYSCRQKGGGLFFRGQAMETVRRAAILRTLNSEDFRTRAGTTCVVKEDPTEIGPSRVGQLAYVCTALPELDVMVLRAKVERRFHHQWELPAPDHIKDRRSGTSTSFYFYNCSDFRRL